MAGHNGQIMEGPDAEIYLHFIDKETQNYQNPLLVFRLCPDAKAGLHSGKYVMHILFCLSYSRDFVAVILPDLSLDSCQVINHTVIEDYKYLL